MVRTPDLSPVTETLRARLLPGDPVAVSGGPAATLAAVFPNGFVLEWFDPEAMILG